MTIVFGHSPPHPERFIKAVINGHHPRLDNHLLDRNIENIEHPFDAADDIGGILDHQHVGSLVHAHRTTG